VLSKTLEFAYGFGA